MSTQSAGGAGRTYYAALSTQRPALVGALLLGLALAWLFLGGGLEALAGRSGLRSQEGAGGLPVVGTRAPSFSLASADGQSIALQADDGQPAVINFWATWCVPCRTEMPTLEAAYQTHRGAGLRLLAVNVLEDREDVVPFGRGLGLTFPLLLDPLGEVAARYGVEGLPTTFFVGRDGRVLHIHQGALSASTLDAQLQRLLQ
ncbi:MAG: TlpA family protein disulfide reductase [Chloroflexi bacterium]|nr:TlpA family protein disulfide reductase [Chloroflexota bacterium]